ncbi:MAG: ribokinase [Woeseiaceae bacterium]|nr:ribokinase [Woeseiaceae bacterium]
MARIVVLGSVNLDLVATVERLPSPGETVTGATLHRYPGGKGANQALAARRLGADVSLIGQVGNDAEAEAALALLRKEGVDLSGVAVSSTSPTGVAMIAVAGNGENQIIVAPGANHAVEFDSLPDADALICQLEVPAHSIAKAANCFDGFFCANLAPARPVETVVLQAADLIVVNETEAAWYGEQLTACRGFVARTFGGEGAELSRGGRVLARSRPPDVDAVDTTAAGDTFVAALTLAFVEKMEPQQALDFATAAGAVAVTRAGAQPSLPTRAEIERVLLDRS